MYYAQLSGDICVAVTQSAGPLVGPQFIPLDSFDVSVLGMRWTGTGWVNP